jgi:addiction module HigA family antidote
MTTETLNSYAPDYSVAPGETLQEALDERGMSQAELARRANRPLKTINEIVKGKASITPETSIQFERVLGIPATFWNKRELDYRATLARAEERRRLEPETGWLDKFPVKEMVKHGLIGRTNDPVDTLSSVLTFFAVSTTTGWDRQWATSPQALFRQSAAFTASAGAVAVWLRWGEIEAQKRSCDSYDERKFREGLAGIRAMTAEPPAVFEPVMKRQCAAGGVAVVFVPELTKTHVSGATRWISSGRAVIQLSNRYKTDDHLWFSFFHEAAHILLHGKRGFFLEGDATPQTEQEEQANRWASDFLVPPTVLDRLKEVPHHSAALIRRTAKELDIAPGILVGRLQHEHILPWKTPLNQLKVHFILRTDQN